MFTNEQIEAREAVWAAAQDGTALQLSADQTEALWRSIMDTEVELAKLRDEVKRYRFNDPTIRTPAVQAALERVRRTGDSAARKEDGTPSNVASVVGYVLNRGAEAVQQEIDHYTELCMTLSPRSVERLVHRGLR